MASPDAVDPISLEPLSSMPYPAFELRADPTFTTVDNDWFDPLTLSSYLVSTGNFTHPISRRELTRADCQSLDAFLELHKCGGGNKCEYAFDHKDEYKAAADARKQMVSVPIAKGASFPHRVTVKGSGGAVVMLRPAGPGTGVIAGAISGRALYDGAIDLGEALKLLDS